MTVMIHLSKRLIVIVLMSELVGCKLLFPRTKHKVVGDKNGLLEEINDNLKPLF